MKIWPFASATRLSCGSTQDASTRCCRTRGNTRVVVATFQGKAEIANDVTEKKMQPVSSALSDAAERAWELCTALRHAKSYGYDREFEIVGLS